jgi:hypothetical protein
MAAASAPGPREQAAALRYVLAVADEYDRQLAGGAPGDAAGVSMTVDEALALAPTLAYLLFDSVCSLAAMTGRGRGERPAFVRGRLLEMADRAEAEAVLFTGLEAEMRGGS